MHSGVKSYPALPTEVTPLPGLILRKRSSYLRWQPSNLSHLCYSSYVEPGYDAM